MEAAITARLERVVQEVIEVRQRAQTLSDELDTVRAEQGALLATLEEERAALAAARAALEAERASLKEQRIPVTVEPVSLPAEELQPVVEPEPLASVEAQAPRLPSPRKLLGKLKLVGRNKGKGEEPATPLLSVTPKEDLFFIEPAVLEAPAPEPEPEVEITETVAFAPVALLLDEEPKSEPLAPVAPVVAEKPKRAAAPRTTKPKKVAVAAPPRFAPREFLASLPGLDDDQLDLAAFGIAQLDDNGGIIALNHRGGILLGTSKLEALDRVLFGDLLPDEDATTRFSEGIALGKLDVVLPVGEGLSVHLFRHAKSRTNWVLLRKQDGEGA